ncbi:hypothetical protein Tco_0704183 [Tanacetum coccineum]|uniref:Uncharacterized protein n=1 Tax=Tanacetum coccineum TaxID=301880 RepID=A0ABQ4Y1U4_9ASTR
MRNRINLHTVRDDSLLGTLKFISKTEDSQKYGALIHDGMINQEIKDSKAYKTYYDFDTGKTTPKKARKFKKIASLSKKLSPVLEAEPAKKPKQARKLAKKSTTILTTGVVIRDTHGVFVSKKKAQTKGDKGKGTELLSDAELLEAAQVKEALNKSKKDSHKLHASGSGDGVGSEPKVPDEYKDKTTGTNEGTDSESTNSDEEENPNLNLKDDEEEETQDDEYVHTPDYYVPTNEETNDENRECDEQEYDDMYKDVDVKYLGAESEKEGKGDAEMTDADQDNTKDSKQSSSVSSDFASKFLNLDNVPPVVDEVASTMNVKPLTSFPQLSTPNPAPTTAPATTLIHVFLDFSSLFGFDQRVSTLEKELSQFKQVDHSAQILASIKSQIPVMVDEHITTIIGFATQTALQSYTAEFEESLRI